MNDREDFQFPTSESRRGNGSDEYARTAAGMRDSLAHARHRLGQTMTSAQERSRHMVDSTSETIQRWPFSAIAVAAGVGLLIGWLIASQSPGAEDMTENPRWWR